MTDANFKIQVKPDTCQGHARCYAIAPEIFDLNDEGFILATEFTLTNSQKKLGIEAVASCPENALRFANKGKS